MAKISLAGFKDPVRRPRYIIWTGVVVLVLAAVMIVALGVTSTRWFCAEACHKVQDDAITSYQRSSHSEVSCMACHMPVGANSIVFILHKAEALGELYLTVTDKFELPLNAKSEVSLTMKATQCTQCHNIANRTVTPSAGIKIDHDVHAKVNAACPVCHNRVAHNESGDWETVLSTPSTGEKSVKHANFMKMDACFRCHGLESGAGAPGTCSSCHTPDFELVPDSHKAKDFFPKGHAELAKEFRTEADKGLAENKTEIAAGAEKASEAGGAEVAKILTAERNLAGDNAQSVGEKLPSVESVFYCSTCHTESFCNDCHGMEIPHPAAFKEPKDPKAADGHPVLSKKQGAKCAMCHTKTDPQFCNNCHHGEKAGGWKYDAKQPWTQVQHPKAVAAGGVKACTTTCHATKFCADCHTGRHIVPSSHRKANWTKPKAPGAVTAYGKTAAQPSAGHAVSAQKSMETCAVCHGSGGTSAKFCKSCHKLAMPHAAEFKKNHVSAKKNPAVCRNCHLFKELCSNCHHVGASTSTPWIKVHGGSVNKNGFGTCVEKCHPEKKDCVDCHTKRNVKPASHRAKNFVRDYSSKKAGHVQLYSKDGEVCTFCHKGSADALPKSKFCSNCHKIAMPHPDGFGPGTEKPTADNGGQHADQFKAKKLNRNVCKNCHQTSFCNSCHHQGASKTKPWVRYHPVVVKKNGAEACFECHKETFCSDCHVNKAAGILGQ